MDDDIECGGFVFVHNFDSGNIGHVEEVVKEINALSGKLVQSEIVDYEFNIWTRPDCAGTEFENGNRTWFYFGIQSAPPMALVRLNIVNLNRQGKMYSQGMAPVTKVIPGKPHWERIKDKPTYCSTENMFSLSFKFRAPENKEATTYFAFTYPYTYSELRHTLDSIDTRYMLGNTGSEDDIYYYRECVCYSLERRQVDLLTVTSQHGITTEREERLTNLFPEQNERPFKFKDKKVIFISARVHPGETPSSFVFNGFLNLLLNRLDPIAIALRKMYVFKMIPILNPDGVAKGHYRTDTRGVNLNRVYLAPSFELHPTVYAARALIRYYHFGHEEDDDVSIDALIPPSCEEDDCLSHKSGEYPDQENDKSYQLHKRKKNNPSKDTSRAWNHSSVGNVTSCRSPLRNALAGTNSAPLNPKTKLAVDSGDDTSSSLLTSGTTLASQVEDLNLNELQNSTKSGFISPPIIHDECAVDTVIKRPRSVGRSKEDSDAHVTDDDDVVVRSLLRDTLKDSISIMLKNSPELSKLSTTDSSAPILSTKPTNNRRQNQPWCDVCKKTVLDLEMKMPGISKILPNIYKNQNASKKFAMNSKLCINCRAPVDTSCDSTDALGPTKEKSDDPKSLKKPVKSQQLAITRTPAKDSHLYLYIDLHGHASKKGIFMYGNHFEDLENCVECMLLPRIMSLNNLHFHFESCNFTKRNMYARDRRDGMSREGSGRVAVLKATGLTRSYTLECNYNTGRMVNVLPPRLRDPPPNSTAMPSTIPPPPKYTPHTFEEVGKSLGGSILDMTNSHPNSRIPGSEHRNLTGVRDWLKLQARHVQLHPSQVQLVVSARASVSSRIRTPISRPSASRAAKQQLFLDPERKENLVAPGFQVDSNSTSTKLHKTSSIHPSAALKALPVRQSRAAEPLSSKTQRNLSLISIKKPAINKHSAVFKAPSRNRSPGPKLRLGSKSKLPDDTESIKGGIRSLMESNRSNTKQHSFKSRILKSDFKSNKDISLQKQNSESSNVTVIRKTKIRTNQSSYQKQPGQAVTKPLSKRLKISQFIKYTDNTKEKYRIRKGPCSKAGSEAEGASSSEDLATGWPGLGVASGSGLGGASTARRVPRQPRRPALRHLGTSASDLTNIRRHKFV